MLQDMIGDPIFHQDEVIGILIRKKNETHGSTFLLIRVHGTVSLTRRIKKRQRKLQEEKSDIPAKKVNKNEFCKYEDEFDEEDALIYF